jgi:DNA invertase Pin-like site-specific DNA recombinase
VPGGDTLAVTKLDRLARSLPDARDIVDELTHRHVKLSLGGSLHDPNDPVGRRLFNVLAMVTEFEADLIKMRTREGMRVAKGPPARQAAEAQPAARGAPGRPAPRRRAQRFRARRPVRGHPPDRLPRHPKSPTPPQTPSATQTEGLTALH